MQTSKAFRVLCVVRSGLRVLCCSQVLEGNSDKNTERYNYLNAPFVARYVRIYPANWSRHIAMRAGLLGCPQTGDACTDGFYRLSPHTQCSTFLRCCTLHILYTSTRRDATSITPVLTAEYLKALCASALLCSELSICSTEGT